MYLFSKEYIQYKNLTEKRTGLLKKLRVHQDALRHLQRPHQAQPWYLLYSPWLSFTRLLRESESILIPLETRQPGRVPQVGTSYLKKKHMAHVLYQIFQEKSMEMVSVCQGFPSHAHQCRQRHPSQVLQVGTWYFQNTTEDLDFVSNIIQHAYNSKFCIL